MKTVPFKQLRGRKFHRAQFARQAGGFVLKNIKPIHWLLLLLLPGLGWGACFSEKITELATSGKTYRATVLSSKRVTPGTCQFTVNIAGTKISGSAKDPLCRTKTHSKVMIQVHTSCCDKPPCNKHQKTRIWFTQPSQKGLLAKMARPPVMAQQKGQALNLGSISSINAGSIAKSQQVKPKVIKNKATITSSSSLAMGKGSAASTQKSQPPVNHPAAKKHATQTSTKAKPAVTSNPLDKYKVVLDVSKHMQKPGPPGVLKVWIGGSEFSPNVSADMERAETSIAAVGQSAKVTPFAPDFDVSPEQSICMKIDSTGSESRFAITPHETGTFKVSADVQLYASTTCVGSPVPKSATLQTVVVTVNKKGIVKYYLLQLWEILWQGIEDFWKWLVATIVVLTIFLIRKRLKKWFGYEAPDNGSTDQ